MVKKVRYFLAEIHAMCEMYRTKKFFFTLLPIVSSQLKNALYCCILLEVQPPLYSISIKKFLLQKLSKIQNYFRLPYKHTGYVNYFLELFHRDTLLFEGVCLLDLKIFDDKIEIFDRN